MCMYVTSAGGAFDFSLGSIRYATDGNIGLATKGSVTGARFYGAMTYTV